MGHVEGHIVEGPSGVAIDPVLRVEQDDHAIGGERRRVDVIRMGSDGVALVEPVRGVVPQRTDRGGGGRGLSRVIRIVIEDGGPGGGFRLPTDHVHGEPVVARRVSIGREEDRVRLAGVDVEVLDDEGLDIVTVSFNHGHVVPLHQVSTTASELAGADVVTLRNSFAMLTQRLPRFRS